MGFMRFKSFLLGILLFFAALGDSLADAHHAIEMVESNNKATGGDKVFPDETKTVTTTKSKSLRGRKMGAKERDEVEAKGPMNTGANPSAGKYDHEGKRELKLESGLSARSIPSRVKLVDLIPLSSDYRAPKTHPPKNN